MTALHSKSPTPRPISEWCDIEISCGASWMLGKSGKSREECILDRLWQGEKFSLRGGQESELLLPRSKSVTGHAVLGGGA